MRGIDPRVQAFFERADAWRAELGALRCILLDTPLDETFKWRSPCYTHEGANVATIWGFRDRCALSFFKGVLLADPDGLLAAPGANSRSVRMMTFTGTEGIAAAEGAIRRFVGAAIANEAAGRKVDLPKDDLDLPPELAGRLDADPALAAAWDALTPGRRRGWALHVAGAVQASTREARIDRAAPRILVGKGMHDR